MHGGDEKQLCCHVVVIGNEGAHDAYMHKAAWSLSVRRRDGPVVWNFPGEPPSCMASEGELGEVREEPPEDHPSAKALASWRAQDEQIVVADPKRCLARDVANMSAHQCAEALQLLCASGLIPEAAQHVLPAIDGAGAGVVGGA